MKIDLYVTSYNDEDFLPFFLDYYLKLVDRITFIDNGSTDKTLPLIQASAKEAGPIIRVVHTGMTWWNWDLGLVIRNNIWKESNYDYILFVDMDEIIYAKDLREFIKKTNYDIYRTVGYNMVSRKFPAPGTDILDINKGVPFPLLNKYVLWKPTSNIVATTAHSIKRTKATICEGKIKLLHYKFLGTPIMLKRAEMIKSRVPPDKFTRGINGNILKVFPSFIRTKKEYDHDISQLLKQAIKVI